MFEVSASIFILILEGFGLTLVLLLLVVFLWTKRSRSQTKAVKQLVARINKNTAMRNQQIASVLKSMSLLEGDELEKSIKKISKQERMFLQKIINISSKNDSDELLKLDVSLAQLIDSYKSVLPERSSLKASSEVEESVHKLTSLEAENEKLRNELTQTKDTMDGMASEFGNMFQGGTAEEDITQDPSK